MQHFNLSQRHIARVAVWHAEQREEIIRRERGRDVRFLRRIKFAPGDIHAGHIQHSQKACRCVDGLAAQPGERLRKVVDLPNARDGKPRNAVFVHPRNIHFFGEFFNRLGKPPRDQNAARRVKDEHQRNRQQNHARYPFGKRVQALRRGRAHQHPGFAVKRRIHIVNRQPVHLRDDLFPILLKGVTAVFPRRKRNRLSSA